MPAVSSGIMTDSNFLNLKAIALEEIRQEVFELFINGEQPVAAFKTVRDQVIFTTKRIFVVNVQGITGEKTSYFSYPYSKIQYFGVETAGVLNIDSELIVAFSNGAKLSFDFRSSVDIRKLNTLISNYVL